MPHDRMLATRGGHTWINKYIFPGGFLPSVEVIDQVTRDETTPAADRAARDGQPLRRDAAPLGPPVPRPARRRARPRLRRPLHADLALLPRLLPGRLRQRLPRRLSSSPSPGRTGDTRDPDRAVRHHADLRGRRRTASPRRSARSSAATCRCACRRGTARSPDPPDAPLVVLRSPDALRRLLWHPGELGAAQAYVTGELDVPEQDGWDLGSALTHAFAVGAERGLSGVRLSPRALVDAVRTAAGLGALGRPPGSPRRRRRRIKGRLHTPGPRPVVRSATTTTSPTSSTPCPRAADGLQLRLPRHPGHPARGGAARQARPRLHQARPRAGHADARRGLRLGLAVAARGRALRGAGHRRDDRGRAEDVHRRPDRRARAAGPGRDPAAGLPRGARARPLRRRRLARDGRARRRSATTRRTSRCCAARSGRAGGCSSSRCRARAPAAASTRAAARSSSRSSPPTCTCGRSARPSA